MAQTTKTIKGKIKMKNIEQAIQILVIETLKNETVENKTLFLTLSQMYKSLGNISIERVKNNLDSDEIETLNKLK